MNELAMLRDYLLKAQGNYMQQATRIAAASRSPDDYQAITAAAKSADVVARILVDMKLLQEDPAEFAKQFLM